MPTPHRDDPITTARNAFLDTLGPDARTAYLAKVERYEFTIEDAYEGYLTAYDLGVDDFREHGLGVTHTMTREQFARAYYAREATRAADTDSA